MINTKNLPQEENKTQEVKSTEIPQEKKLNEFEVAKDVAELYIQSAKEKQKELQEEVAENKEDEKAEEVKKEVEVEIEEDKNQTEQISLSELHKVIQKRDDGMFVWKVDPSNENSTKYVGKTISEVFANAAKGYAEKDKYISKLKSEKSVSHKETEEALEIHIPSQEQITKEVLEHYKNLGVTEEMLYWDDDDWNAYERETASAVITLEKMQTAKQLNKYIKELHTEQNVNYLNAEMLSGERVNIKNMLTDLGIEYDNEELNVEEIIKEAKNDKKNRYENNLIIGGSITSAVAKKALTLLKGNALKQAEDEVNNKISKTTEALNKQKQTTKSKTISTKPSSIKFKSFDEITKSVLEELNGG